MSEPLRCTIHLVSLKANKPSDLSTLITEIQTNDLPGFLIRGLPCGWVHAPHRLNKSALTSKTWDLFFVTRHPDLCFGGYVSQFVETHLSIPAEIPKEQADVLLGKISRSGTNGFAEEDKPVASSATPPLPSSWTGSNPNKIPPQAIGKSRSAALRVGELYLDDKMANYLSTAEPEKIRGSPTCFFNLFKYAGGMRDTHDSYMNGFKEKFGPDAGAEVKFMGPVTAALKVDGNDEGHEIWDDTNLVQYDSVWHYAYMLSTDVYQELNQEKMRGLEDTCILMVSEVAFQDLIKKIPGEIVTI